MSWSERQTAMLEAMGLRLWPKKMAKVVAAAPAMARPDPAPHIDATPPVAPAARPARPALAPVSAAPVPVAAPIVPAVDTTTLAQLDWAGLREAVTTCQACALCESRTQALFGQGSDQAHWMVVGEVPGEPEDLSGEPFAAQSGQLLDNMLRAAGLSRAESAAPEQAAFVSTALKCRPPRSRSPEPNELARCEPYLMRQIELLKPRVILAMGPRAAQALLHSNEPLGRLRGRVHDCHGIPVIVTYHPSYLLRSPADKARAWEDLCLALDTLRARAH